jgi:Protein of unknown function (DUF1194)
MTVTRSRMASAKRATFGAAVAAIAFWPGAGFAAEVDMKLVIATDVSRSIDDEEGRLQREGTAEAFSNPGVIKAIQGGALGRIAVAMIDFSSPEYNKVVLDWHVIKDSASANAFADLIRAAPRTPGRRTSISSALELGQLLLEESDNDIIARRKVIDVSGDGPNNDGHPMMEVHDRVVANGIVVNGLPIMDDMDDGHSYYPNLDKYYAGCVVGGKGSFVLAVHSFRDFGAAMRHKLILEISGIAPTIEDAEAGGLRAPVRATEAPLVRVATDLAPQPVPRAPRPSKGFGNLGCDIFGGFGYGGF